MTAQPATPAEEPAEAPKRKQMNVRLPPELIDEIDDRRSARSLSRDQWVERALRFALHHNPAPRTPTRTAVRRP